MLYAAGSTRRSRSSTAATRALGAAAAFEAMRTYAVRTADDPWAVVTMAVKVTLIAEERADGLLCSVDQARRPEISRHHDVRRFCDTEADLPNFLPALAVEPFNPDETPPTGAYEAVDATIDLFTALGWPRDTATCTLDYISARLVESGSRPKAHAALRRDHPRGRSSTSTRRRGRRCCGSCWAIPNPDEACTSDGHGVLLRLLIGHPVAELLDDDLLVFEISETAPRPKARIHV